MTDFRTRLTAGFKALRREGYFARQGWKCCQGCGCAAIPSGKGERYAFYHAQDAAYLTSAAMHDSRGKAPAPEDVGVYLAWAGDGNLIAETFRKAGCTVVWNGNGSTRIWVCAGPDKDPVAEADAAYRAQLEAL